MRWFCVLFVQGPGTIAKDHGIRVRVPQRDLGQVAPGQISRPFGHPLKDGVEIQGGVEALREVGHDFDLSPLLVPPPGNSRAFSMAMAACAANKPRRS